jgi:hypothetical protein
MFWEAWTGFRAQRWLLIVCLAVAIFNQPEQTQSLWFWTTAVILWGLDAVTYLNGYASAIVMVGNLSAEARQELFKQLDQASNTHANH